MDKTIQGDNQAWNRLSGGNQHNPGNKMEYPSHTNSRGSAGRREAHAEGDQVGSDDDKEDDRSEHRRGGGLKRHCHAYGQQPGQYPQQPQMTQPQQPVQAQQSYQNQTPQQQQPLQQQPRALRRGGRV